MLRTGTSTIAALAVALLFAPRARAETPPPAAPAPSQTLPPVPVERADAVFPEGAPSITTDVVLAVVVNADGHVGEMQVVTSGGPAFDAAAMAAAARWRFTPATRDGQPIPARIRLSFHFEPPVAPPPLPKPPPPPPPVAPALAPVETKPVEPIEVTAVGHRPPPSRGATQFDVTLGALGAVPKKDASEAMKIAPGILLTNDGGEGHAEQVFLRGFDAREMQDIEASMQGVPINESGNLHGNGYADTHFIIPELISSLHLLEGPFDPRQGNYAVAGSVDFQLGLDRRGLTATAAYGSFNTQRLLLLWGPQGGSTGTFAGVDLYRTDGFGQNRDGQRGTAMTQYETRFGGSVLRVGADAYIASFHSAGILREDDYVAGRECFFCTYDPRQGADTSRYQVYADLESHAGGVVTDNEVFGIARPMRLLENFTGFLLDPQEPQQNPHPQRGDLIDLDVMEYTVGARGSARVAGVVAGERQELEAGYYARGDFVHSQQSRIEAATNAPYHIDNDLDSRLGDIGLYLDGNLRPWRYLALRGGVRADLLTYDVLNNCAVQQVAHPSRANPPGDAPCLSQEDFGLYREPFQRVTTSGLVVLPRVSAVLGPWRSFNLSTSWGEGVQSVDPVYVSQDVKTPFASARSVDAGVSWARRLALARPLDVSARASFYHTTVDHDLLFSSTAGRNVLCGASERDGITADARATGRFFDVDANANWVRAIFTDNQCGPTGSLIPYIPPVIVQLTGALYGDLPWRRLALDGHRLRGSLTTGITYVAPRPLPGAESSGDIFTVDARGTIGWRNVDLGVSVANLLDAQYQLGVYNYLSDFTPVTHAQSLPTLVPARMFSAGAPRTVMFTLTVNLGGAS